MMPEGTDMYRHLRTSVIAGVSLSLALAAAISPVAAAPQPDERSSHQRFEAEEARLSKGMAAALRSAGFDQLVDFDNRIDGVAQPAAFLPNIDLAVIELDSSGHVIGAANILYDRDNPRGYVVDIDRKSLRAMGVEFSRWSPERFADPASWAAGPAAEDILVQPTKVRKEYMLTYPASVLKLMVGYSILRLVDQGRLRLNTEIVYHEEDGKTCQYPPSNPEEVQPPPQADGATDTVTGWLDQMITVSDNFATCVLLQAIYDTGALEEANAHFKALGLSTLVMQPQNPAVGAGWQTGHFSMGSLDTARLLLLVAGASGRLWQAPGNRAITASSGLSAGSRRYFEGVLAQQSFNEVLNPVNLCGSTDAVQGIPSTVSKRWIDPKTGNVVTYDGDVVIDFGYNVRPCVSRAEVKFAHKTGLVSFAGSDAGIVRALPGQDGRMYVVSIQSSVGYRYGDPDWATSDPNACLGSPYVCYSRAFGRVGLAVDNLVKARS